MYILITVHQYHRTHLWCKYTYIYVLLSKMLKCFDDMKGLAFHIAKRYNELLPVIAMY